MIAMRSGFSTFGALAPPKKRSFQVVLILLLFASCSSKGEDRICRVQPSLAAGQSRQVLGEGIGIQVQAWYLKSGDLAGIAASGFSVVRWGIAWERVEKVAGVYDWREMDQFVSTLAAHRLRSIVILGYGNRLYEDQSDRQKEADPNRLVEARAPATASARAAFARFAAVAAARYRDQPITWEIWNEPDNQGFWQPRPDPLAYAALARQTCLAVRKMVPDATILGGVGAAMPNAVSHHENIYSAMVENGAIDCLDGVSSHAYRMSGYYHEPDPESLEDDNSASQAYLYSKLRIKTEKPFIISEWGYSTYNLSDNLQAAYLIRANLINAASGIPLTVWYEWRDSQTGSGNPESSFGLLTMHGGPKNSLDVSSVLSKIAKSRFVKRLATTCTDARIYLLQKDGRGFLVGWRRTNDESIVSKLYVNGADAGELSFMPRLIEIEKKTPPETQELNRRLK